MSVVCKLTVRDFMHERGGVRHLRVSGKGEKTRYVPLHGISRDLIEEYLQKSGHAGSDKGALFVLCGTPMGAVGKKQLRQMAFTSWSASTQLPWGTAPAA